MTQPLAPRTRQWDTSGMQALCAAIPLAPQSAAFEDDNAAHAAEGEPHGPQ